MLGLREGDYLSRFRNRIATATEFRTIHIEAMRDDLPVGSLKIGADLEVRLGGKPLAPAPNRSVAALLVGLADRNGEPISRDEAASRLYRESSRSDARNALRMTLIRLSSWIGSQYVQKDRDRITLLGRWELTSAEGRQTYGAGIRSHPWVSEIVARSTGGVDLLATRLVKRLNWPSNKMLTLQGESLLGREKYGAALHDMTRSA